jgi:hypothetical protein
MEKQTFVEYVIDMVTDKHYTNLSEDFKKQMQSRMEEMYQRYLDDAYKKGNSVGYMEGLSKAIKTLNTK